MSASGTMRSPKSPAGPAVPPGATSSTPGGNTGILAGEERYPERCHRVRYEDLVEQPDAVTRNIFEFLGLPPFPGIADRCFSADHDRFGRGFQDLEYVADHRRLG